MPLYTYKCLECDSINEFNLSISIFIKTKNELNCKLCLSGNISRQVMPINSAVEKNLDEIINNTKEDIKKIIKKVNLGDIKTIETIYGNE